MTANRAPRMAVVGVGHFGRHHARVLSELDQVRLEAVVDVDGDRAAAVAAEFGTRAFDSIEALEGQVDAVTLAVPTEAHSVVAVPLLARGVSVLVEKPIARSLREADAMLAAAAESGAILAVGHTERFNPAVAAALPLVRSPRFIEVHRIGAVPSRSLDIDVVFDLMIHDLDIIATAVDSPLDSVEAVGVPVLSDRVDIANARLCFETGCIANLTASRISRDRVRKLRFFQQDAYISIDCSEQQVEGWRVRRGGDEGPAIEGGRLEIVAGEPLVRELTDFVSAVRAGTPSLVDGRAGRRALELAQRVAEAMAAERARTELGASDEDGHE